MIPRVTEEDFRRAFLSLYMLLASDHPVQVSPSQILGLSDICMMYLQQDGARISDQLWQEVTGEQRMTMVLGSLSSVPDVVAMWLERECGMVTLKAASEN